MAASNFNTRNDTWRKLLGNGLVYRVPRFQRDYSWGEGEWDDLWQDILGTIRPGGESAHYMGYLVLQSADERTFEIIDGQQRLTTLSIIVLAALKNIKRLIDAGVNVEDNARRLEGLRQSYVGFLNPVTLVASSKLTLNRNNDHYFQTYLVPLADLPKRGFKASEHSLRKAFEWYDQRIEGHFSKSRDKGKEIAKLVDDMSDRLFFTVITVADELNAYKVFETLNARGVKLSATDLLKNYLFSVLHRDGKHEHEFKALDDRWERIVSRLGNESFTDFLRVHWISRRDFIRQTELFKSIRSSVAGSKEVFELLSAMEEDVDPYLALVSPEGSDWTGESKNSALDLRMFSVRQPFPLILAAKRRASQQDFNSLMRSLVVISFRYNVIGNLQTSEQERTYASATKSVLTGGATTLGDILKLLEGIYPSDDAFASAFREKTISTSSSRNNKIVRYLLGRLENQMGGSAPDPQSDTLSIEHICPLNPTIQWGDFSDDDIDAFSTRLGNMTLLEAGKNKDLGDAPYDHKRPVYERSSFRMTREVAQHNSEWTPQRISERQATLAKFATATWRIAQLS